MEKKTKNWFLNTKSFPLVFVVLVGVNLLWQFVSYVPNFNAKFTHDFDKTAFVSLNDTGDQNRDWKCSITAERCVKGCTYPSKQLDGPVKTYQTIMSMNELEKRINWTKQGGRYVPSDCWTNHRVAIVVPYRNRTNHLRIFLLNIHKMLPKQKIEYGIFVIEQTGDTRFNRALLMNIGYAEAVKQHDYNCFVFHDVDLIPEDDRNFYGCGENPRHLSAAIDKYNYILQYPSIFGGVSQVPRKLFEAVNGYSNKYFGWGCEDDDMWNRLRNANLKIDRASANIARYKMIRHTREKLNQPNPLRKKLLREGQRRFKTDGLNSLEYKLVNIEHHKLYTLVSISVNETQIMSQ